MVDISCGVCGKNLIVDEFDDPLPDHTDRRTGKRCDGSGQSFPDNVVVNDDDDDDFPWVEEEEEEEI